jgi:hypothetical protein
MLLDDVVCCKPNLQEQDHLLVRIRFIAVDVPLQLLYLALKLEHAQILLLHHNLVEHSTGVLDPLRICLASTHY